MEQPLTPPPSFRILRVRNHTRARTTSNENRCVQSPPNVKGDSLTAGAFPCADPSSSPARGRTRSRVVRTGLAVNSNVRSRPHLSLAMPPCCSPPPSNAGPRSPGYDDDLIFQMSPILPQSPTAVFFNSANKAHVDVRQVEQSSIQTLSALWENHKRVTQPSVVAADAHRKQGQVPHTPHKRTRTGTVTQHHQRGFSDSVASKPTRRERHGDHRPQQSVKTLLDLSVLLRAPPTPPSPHAEPFMYSFPSFESGPLVKARQARARRIASKTLAHGVCPAVKMSSGIDKRDSDGLVDVDMEIEMNATGMQHPGPIRARKLRIESGESLCDDVEDANFISHAFRSASLDHEKNDAMDDNEDAEEEEGYYSSQRSSSVSSFATDATSLNQSSVLSSSLLASFPVRAASQSQSHSNSSSRSHSRRVSPGPSETVSSSKLNVDTSANAMLARGRPSIARSRRTSAEVREMQANLGPDRRGCGRAPAPAWRSGESVHVAAAAMR